MKFDENYDIAVVGGGAAGMLAAAIAAQDGAKVLLIEKNDRFGKKLRITGKGRCNVTNNCSVQDFIRNVPCNGRFLYSSLSRFSPDDTMAFFEELGVELKTERGDRVFPVSDKAEDIVSALRNFVKRSCVNIKHTKAEKILAENGGIIGISLKSGAVGCKAVILCTGGASYPLTGSDGAGYKMAAAVGHTVTEISPSLVPLTVAGDDCAKMQGLSLRNVTLSVFSSSGKCVYKELGELLFTHFGLSSPLPLSASVNIRNFKNEK